MTSVLSADGYKAWLRVLLQLNPIISVAWSDSMLIGVNTFLKCARVVLINIKINSGGGQVLFLIYFFEDRRAVQMDMFRVVAARC